MKPEITLVLDALNSSSELLLDIREKVKTEQDAKALQALMAIAVEYITQLNLMLLKSLEELQDEGFKVRLTLDAVDNFIGGVQDLRNTYESPMRRVGIGA